MIATETSYRSLKIAVTEIAAIAGAGDRVVPPPEARASVGAFGQLAVITPEADECTRGGSHNWQPEELELPNTGEKFTAYKCSKCGVYK